MVKTSPDSPWINGSMDFLMGGLAGVCTGIFTNPLEVIKTRMQLQGELTARGQHPIHYKNVFHATYAIAKHDGLSALQTGLGAGLWYQLFFNGFRLGMYQIMDDYGTMEDKNGERMFIRSFVISGLVGVVGSYAFSPLYLVKTQLHAKAAKEIAFGHQHEHGNLWTGMVSIWRQNGIKGLYTGGVATITRAFVGSCSQLTSFAYAKDYVDKHDLFEGSTFMTIFAAAMVGGVADSVASQPFDLVATRLYNQGVDAQGKGLLYSGWLDCVSKIWNTEGAWGFYKGLGPQYFRLGPHTMLLLTFWDEFKNMYKKMKNSF